MMIKIILYLTLILIDVKFSYNYIVFPFNDVKSNNKDKEESIQESINNFLSNEQLYTLITLSDNLTTELYLNTRFYYFFLEKDYVVKILCRNIIFKIHIILKM